MKKTIKLIDLLKMFANKEKMPKKVLYDGRIYTWHDKDEDYHHEVSENKMFVIFNRPYIVHYLNEEVEIIEKPKEIEELDYRYKNMYGNTSQHKYSEIDIIDKINELIKAVNYLLEREENK